MMPDTSLVDVAAIVGSFVAALVAGLGLRRGENAKSLPAPSEAHASGVFVGFDSDVARAQLAELRDLRADLARWRDEDEERRQQEQIEEKIEQRIGAVQASVQAGQRESRENQETMLALIRSLRRQIDDPDGSGEPGRPPPSAPRR